MSSFDQINWEYWTGRLRELPAAAPEWEGIEKFIQDVTRIATNKLLERNDLRRRIHASLVLLRSEYADELTGYGLHTDTWSDVNCDLTQIEDILSRMEKFFDLLKEERHISEQLPQLKKTGLRQYLGLVKRQLEVAETIHTGFAELSVHFSPAAAVADSSAEAEEDEDDTEIAEAVEGVAGAETAVETAVEAEKEAEPVAVPASLVVTEETEVLETVTASPVYVNGAGVAEEILADEQWTSEAPASIPSDVNGVEKGEVHSLIEDGMDRVNRKLPVPELSGQPFPDGEVIPIH